MHFVAKNILGPIPSKELFGTIPTKTFWVIFHLEHFGPVPTTRVGTMLITPIEDFFFQMLQTGNGFNLIYFSFPRVISTIFRATLRTYIDGNSTM